MTTATTPMMKQWHECKKQAPDALLLFRLGDFYEAFYDDAIEISKEIQLTLTKRQGIPMCGVPYHSSESYIDQLIEKGHKIAVAEQIGDPKQTKSIVKREVVRVITPGSLTHSSLLKDKSNNFFIALSQISSTYGLALVDLSTSEFRVMELGSEQELIDELFKQKPAELLVSCQFIDNNESLFEEVKEAFTFVLTKKENWQFDFESALEFLKKHLQVQNLDGYGLKGLSAATTAAGALLSHLEEYLHLDISHIRSIQKDSLEGYMSIDRSTLRHLELLDPLHESNSKSTLFALLDTTLTPMGARKLCSWIKRPLYNIEAITQRHNAVEELVTQTTKRTKITEHLGNIRDLERLIMRISNRSASPRDLVSLSSSLCHVMSLKKEISEMSSALLTQSHTQIQDMSELINMIQHAIVDSPPLRSSDKGIFRSGFNKELDEYRSISQHSQDWLTSYQQELRDTTQIKTIKVGYTRVFGYYIEVSKAQAKHMPASFQRRQTLVNAERFISEELKAFEYKILGAEDKIKALESKLYQTFLEQVARYCQDVQRIAAAVSNIDCLASFAECSVRYKYIRATIDKGDAISIHGGRHPIIDQALVSSFIPNDTYLNSEDQQLLLITGPNMAGKSTYIRQVALIVIMAQIGCFVPADEARIGLVDKVFSRIGASDDLSRGQSTFMVEMTETANILHHATSRSLVILDEIGRGTSTYDGIAIAWSVAEYLLTIAEKKAKTLFATHYWELTQLEKEYKTVKNYQVAVKETSEGIIFLHKIIRGDTDRSYGIHVARLAGLPFEALQSAQKRLLSLEKKHRTHKPLKAESQMSLFEEKPKPSKVVQELKKVDVNAISPMQALQKLLELQHIAEHEL